MTYKQWLVDQHYRMATDYRIALDREISAVKRILPTLDDTGRSMLVQALKEIPLPAYDEYTGSETREEKQFIYHNTTKPNYARILAEAVEKI